MSWFDRFRRRRTPQGTPAPSPEMLRELREFLASRDGVEAFVEPPTTVYAMSVCLVAADGEYLRRPVRDERQAREIASAHGVPLYDARIVGYPKRMRDYETGVRRERVGLDDMPPLDVTEERDGDEHRGGRDD